MKQRWTRQTLVDELRRRAKAGPLWFRHLRRDHRRLLSAVDRVFGNWRAGLKAAGIPVECGTTNHGPVTLSKEIVVRILREAWRRRDIRIKQLRANVPGIYKAARRCFGSWQEALRAAGVPATAYTTRNASYRAFLRASR